MAELESDGNENVEEQGRGREPWIRADRRMAMLTTLKMMRSGVLDSACGAAYCDTQRAALCGLKVVLYKVTPEMDVNRSCLALSLRIDPDQLV